MDNVIATLRHLGHNFTSVDNYNSEVVLHFEDRDSAIAAMSDLMSQLYDGMLADENVRLTIELRNEDWALIVGEAEDDEEK